jgi:hypothetical protein
MPVVCSANTKDKVKKFKEYTNRDRKDAQTIGTNIYLYIGRPLVPKSLVKPIGTNRDRKGARTIGTRPYTKVHPTPN